jgi:uncharacterized serine/threonine-protein kinase SgK494
VKNEVGIQSICGHHPFILNCPFFWQNRTKLFIGKLYNILKFGLNLSYVMKTVSEYMVGGELLALWQKYGTLPQPLVKIYIAELALVLGKF